MLVRLNDLPSFCFQFPTASVPTRYWVVKQGDFGTIPGGGTLGAGTITTIYNATGAEGTYKVQLAAGETDTLGDLTIVVDDAVAESRLAASLQVVVDLPGETVTSVLGNVVGNLLGTIAVGTRLAIAEDVWALIDGIELGLVPRNAMKAMMAVLAGKSQTQPGGVTFRNFGDTADRVIVAFNPDGSRTVVIINF